MSGTAVAMVASLQGTHHAQHKLLSLLTSHSSVLPVLSDKMVQINLLNFLFAKKGSLSLHSSLFYQTAVPESN